VRKADEKLAKIIGANARACRMRLPATQEEVAERVDLSAQVYARLERGGMLPSLNTLMRLCSLFDVRPDDILLSQGRIVATDTLPIGPADARIARAIADLDEEDARLVLALAKRLRSVRKVRA
jgi:transcriptional regulator with XRE-family HTH domain